ncbi:WD40 repeat domain-containing protein [Streptomyces sp. MUM 178J]|uniref:WD40 repeat domain-containing protein n=1 Tax=Streptomyces sp. MUM 178J TaxID=2791991 RepID=UPI001F04EDBF|nr:WD40 repeat domain-containing protein [Streptomyces sp. MUM 178J]WRQ82813.1 WD40 repeat domain-containing protein [Streptomyces sp. MUM 178J]
MRSPSYVAASAAFSAALAAATVLTGCGAAAADDSSFTIKDQRITESSGLAASKRHPGVYWTHNDQDEGPYLYAVDSETGETVARVAMRGVGEPRDMEAVSVGPDGDVYVGDIGDNLGGGWDHVWIYRFPEPEKLSPELTVRATQYTVRYEDGARDAEALMVHPATGRVYIASKNEDGGGLYEGPATLTASGANVFRRIAEVPWVTDGAFSPDGGELLLRSYFSARAYEWKDGRPGADRRVRAPIQRQAESVAYTPDGSALMFGTEGAQSTVQRVELEGRQDKTENGETGEKEKGGSAAEGGASSSDGDRNLTYGLVAAAGLGALVLWLRGMRRKG